MSIPKVSIVVPAYNAERFLEKSLNSVLEQTFPFWEMTVVNDGSTDRTQDIIRSYIALDNRITGINHGQNLGLSSARNSGMRSGTGKYVAFLDSDDCWFANKLEKQVAYLDYHPDIRASFTGIELIDENNKLVETWDQIHKKYPDSCVNESLLIIKQNVIVGGGSTLMMRRSLIEEIGYFDESMRSVEDWDYWFRIAQKGALFLVPYKLAQIRRHSTSLQANSVSILLGKLMFLKKARNNSSEELIPGLNVIEVETLYRLAANYWHSRRVGKSCNSLFKLIIKYPRGTLIQIKETLLRKFARQERI
jgi:glycosyltransferase involved in cell wall biosynthesis